MSKLLSLAFLAVSSLSASAQVATTVGPLTTPLGGEVSMTLSNDNPGKFGVLSSLWRVRDAGGATVFQPTTPSNALLLGPGGWFTQRWDLCDQSGAPVAPGTYLVDIQFETWSPVVTTTVEVVAEGAGLVLEGSASIQPVFGGGPGRNFYLTSPSDPGKLYLLLASTSATVGVPTCGPILPLDASPLLTQSLVPGALFTSSVGVLNAQGESTAPRLKLPSDSSLVGLTAETAFLVLDPAAPCLVARSSNVHSLVIVP
ncbi:MAG: hypothetical protein P1V81_05425 [Planctomycetota bacterium]|nr:hypothetical protein [Planctomycetota bacterium]